MVQARAHGAKDLWVQTGKWLLAKEETGKEVMGKLDLLVLMANLRFPSYTTPNSG